MDNTPLVLAQLPALLDLAAIAAGALFGTAVAVARKAPLVGVMLLGVLMGLGGGMIRDALLDVPVEALHNDMFLPVAVGVSLLGLPIARRITEHPYVGLALDGLSLGMFVMVGTEKAVILGYSASAAILIGLITAIGGGTIVDLLVGERPMVMRHGPWFASAAVVGAALFVVLYPFIVTGLVEVLVVATVASIRFTSERMGYAAPSVQTLRNIKRK